MVDEQPLADDHFNHPGHPNPERQCYNNGGRMVPGWEITVPEGYYFVLGDGQQSFDSRYAQVGFIRAEDIVGRLILRIWPLHRLGIP